MKKFNRMTEKQMSKSTGGAFFLIPVVALMAGSIATTGAALNSEISQK